MASQQDRLKQLAGLVAEKSRRESESLRLFRPLPGPQDQFLHGTALKRVIRGGNRCLGGEQEIYDPVAKVSRKVSEITEPFHVESWDELTGKFVTVPAEVPFKKPRDSLYRWTLSSGESFVATKDHVVRSKREWKKLKYVGQSGFLNSRFGGHVQIISVEFIRVDDVWDFTVPGTHNYICCNTIHHNSGKSTLAALEFAHAATGIPLFNFAGYPVPDKYPRKNPLLLWVIGFDLDHVARNIHRLLFQPGAFKLIKDKQTGLLRAWRPWEEEDEARIKEVVLSDPLIPERFIDEFAWENKAQRVFKACRLKNGNEIRAFSSQGKEPQGDQCDLIWVDEDVENSELINEAVMRLVDRGGRMFWSAFPKSKNFALKRLSKEAAETDPASPTCQEFVLRMSDNPYLNKKAQASILAGMTDEERRARDYGEFLDDLVAMFPSFDPVIHGTPRPTEDEHDLIDKALAENKGQPPADWTRYLVLDPGHARPAVLMAAVPPPELEAEHRTNPTLVCYDEIAVPRIDATRLAELVKQRCESQFFEAFIIDWHAGRQTSMGRGDTVLEHYSKEFEKKGLRSRITGSAFIHGSDNIMAGNEMIRGRLGLGKDGRGSIRVVADRCPKLCEQLVMYKKSVDARNLVDDRPAPHQVDDLVDCLRYLVAFEPKYRRPEKIHMENPVWDAFQKFMKRRKRRPDSVSLGALGGVK